ncbi:MAG: hypothetical protein K2J20_05805 [Bacilli bacterium]|nr:hypothetical protein [Bacilli bacterium]
MGRQRNYELGLYHQLEEMNTNLKNANNTIFHISLELSNVRNDLKDALKANNELKEQNQKLILEIERLKNNNKKDSSNSNKPSSTNGYKKVKLNNREKSNKKQGGQLNHKGTTLTKDDVDKMITNGEIKKIKMNSIKIINL